MKNNTEQVYLKKNSYSPQKKKSLIVRILNKLFGRKKKAQPGSIYPLR
jgi:hypothetical protein